MTAKPSWKEPLSSAQVSRVWLAVSTRLDRRSRPNWRLWLVTLLPAACLALALGVRSARPFDAAPAAQLQAGTVVADRTRFSDGSTVSPERGTTLEVLRSSPSELVALQRTGRCRYEVTPGGPRRWVVETDLATIEVVGTIFTVDRRSADVEVSVERGKVFVRGQGHAQTIGPGQRLRISRGAATAPRRDESGDETLAPDVSASGAGSAGSVEPPAPPTKRQLRAAPEAPATPSARALLDRIEGASPAAAAAQLSEWLATSPPSSDWAVVAYRLGMLERQLGRTAQALQRFEAVLRVGSPTSTVEDAAAQRVTTLFALGRRDEARREAASFRARWPRSVWISSLPTEPTVSP